MRSTSSKSARPGSLPMLSHGTSGFNFTQANSQISRARART
jgi:hypothetical protein